MELEKPSFNVEVTFKTSISNFRRETRACLEQSLPAIIDAEKNYEEIAANGRMCDILIDDLEGTYATKEQLKKVYTDKFSRKDNPAREYYDAIMMMPMASRCPYCGQRVVSTIDHFLCKNRYPKLTVTPINLIPACSDCNRNKHNDIPQRPGDYYIHPYYDSIDKFEWLYAKIIYGKPIIIDFYVKCDTRMEPDIANRINFQFKKLKLNEFYSIEANNELLNKKFILMQILTENGSDGVQKYLGDEFQTYNNRSLNSWQTAMYRILSGEENFYMNLQEWMV